MCLAPELRNGADLRRMDETACPISGQRREGKSRVSGVTRFASAADQGTWILQCSLSSVGVAEKLKKFLCDPGAVHEELIARGSHRSGRIAGEPPTKTAANPKLHQILQQMNGGKRFCFDFRSAQLLLSVSLGRSNRKNGAGKHRWRVLKSMSIFFNPRSVTRRSNRLKTQIGLADPPHSSAKIWAP